MFLIHNFVNAKKLKNKTYENKYIMNSSIEYHCHEKFQNIIKNMKFITLRIMKIRSQHDSIRFVTKIDMIFKNILQKCLR